MASRLSVCSVVVPFIVCMTAFAFKLVDGTKLLVLLASNEVEVPEQCQF